MQLAYTVHSCAPTPVTATVTRNGKEMQVTIPGLVVELVPDDGTATMTLRFIPDDMEAALALYAVDAHLHATFSPIPAE
jgi:hypothetical protein